MVRASVKGFRVRVRVRVRVMFGVRVRVDPLVMTLQPGPSSPLLT